MQPDSMNRAVRGALILTVLALGGCASERTSGPSVAPLPAAPSGRVTSAPLPGSGGAGAVPAVSMAGRWILSSPGAGQCGINFTATKPTEGAVAPEGGCPGDFFTARFWGLDSNGLVIRNHNRKTLARLKPAPPPGDFEGQAASGIGVTLQR